MEKGQRPGVINCSVGLSRGSGLWFQIIFITNVLKIVSTVRRGFDFLPGLSNKAKGGISSYCRALVFVIPGLAGLPFLEGKMDKLIENVFLVTIDVKNIRSSLLVRER